MEASTLACVEQHLGFIALIVYRPLRKPELGHLLQQYCPDEPIYFLTLRQSVINTPNFALVCNRAWYALLYSKCGFECFFWHSLCSTLQGLLGISTVTSSGYYMLLYAYWIESMPPSWLRWSLRCICTCETAKQVLQRWLVDKAVDCGATMLAGDLSFVKWQTSWPTPRYRACRRGIIKLPRLLTYCRCGRPIVVICIS